LSTLKDRRTLCWFYRHRFHCRSRPADLGLVLLRSKQGVQLGRLRELNLVKPTSGVRFSVHQSRVRAFDAPFGRAGMLICEDCWHPACAWILAQQGMDVLLVASNGPTRGARPGRGITSLSVWQDLLRVTARLETAFVVYVNRVGYEDGLNFGGGSTAIDPFGRVLATLPALEPALEVVDLDAGVLRRARIAYPLLRDENLELAAREIDRIRQLRYDLPAGTREDPAGPERS